MAPSQCSAGIDDALAAALAQSFEMQPVDGGQGQVGLLMLGMVRDGEGWFWMVDLLVDWLVGQELSSLVLNHHGDHPS